MVASAPVEPESGAPVLHCPLCATEQKRVRLVPLGRFFVHEDGKPRARRCHVTTFTPVVAEAKVNTAPQ